MPDSLVGQIPRELYSVVVLGAMNPRIHHPQWYRLIGAISEDENRATLNGNVVTVPVLSQFEVDAVPFIVLCQADRWEIKTSSRDAVPRILDVTARVFEKLNETPIKFFGLNTIVHRRTALASVKEGLGQRSLSLGLGLPIGQVTGCMIQLSVAEEGFTTTVQLAPSTLDESSVQVSYNNQFEVGATGGGGGGGGSGGSGYFNLGELLRSKHDAHLQRASEMIDKVVAGLNRN